MAHTLLSLTPWWQLLVTIARLLFVYVRPFLTSLSIFCLSMQDYFWPTSFVCLCKATFGQDCASFPLQQYLVPDVLQSRLPFMVFMFLCKRYLYSFLSYFIFRISLMTIEPPLKASKMLLNEMHKMH